MEEIKAYKCDYCHRCFGRKVNALQHQHRCINNPEKRACKTCVHGVLAVIDYVDGHEIMGAYCDEYEMSIHECPYTTECDYYDNIPGSPPIPFTCQNYLYKGKAEWTKESR
jgi:hypothetical protein